MVIIGTAIYTRSYEMLFQQRHCFQHLVHQFIARNICLCHFPCKRKCLNVLVRDLGKHRLFGATTSVSASLCDGIIILYLAITSPGWANCTPDAPAANWEPEGSFICHS
jgi:hypothetical protein